MFVYRKLARGVAVQVLRDVEEPIEATLAGVVRQLGHVREEGARGMIPGSTADFIGLDGARRQIVPRLFPLADG